MKKFLFILISLLIGIGFALISLELFLRLNPKFGYIHHSLKLLTKSEAPMVTHANIRPSTLLDYEHIPNYNPGVFSHGYNPRLNSYGLIGEEYKLEKDKGIYRILFLGDSIAAQSWSGEFLEDELNNLKLHLRYKFEIWNAAVAGYDVRRYYIYLKHKGLNYNPDMVLIFFCMDDFGANMNICYKIKDKITAYYFPLTEISKRYTVNPFLIRHSYLYRFVILRVNSYLLSKKKIQGIDPDEENGRYYLQMIKEICENNKIPLFVVIFPYLKPLDEYKDYQIYQYKTICKVIKDLRIKHLNLYEHLPKESLYSLRVNKGDEIHPSREGHRLIAKIIYDYMLDNFFKDK